MRETTRHQTRGLSDSQAAGPMMPPLSATEILKTPINTKMPTRPPPTRFALIALSVLLCAYVLGCSSNSRGSAAGLILFVPGVAGDGASYRNIVPALRDAGDERTVESFGWGAPSFAFFMNFNNVTIHESAEKKLAARIVDFRTSHPDEPLDIIAHSAGGGVTLGALRKLPEGIHVGRVLLMHPSVSPTYPVTEALRCCDSITLVHSDRDTTFLKWRTSHFGTYDNVKTTAAGNAGFDLSKIDASARGKLLMVRFEDSDRSLGNDGGHFGPLASAYLRKRIMPLFARPTTDASHAR